MDQQQQPQLVQVDVRFLQAILEYFKTRPYEEVWMFMDVLLGRQNQQQTQQPVQEPNIKEYTQQ